MYFGDEADINPQYFQPLEEVTLRSHIPPSPNVTKIRFENTVPYMAEKKRSLLETVLHWPPLPGQAGDDEIKIKLLGELVPPGDDRQRLFLCYITSFQSSLNLPTSRGNDNSSEMRVVAEIFDPLCFIEDDPSTMADFAYSHTATSYDLLKDLQGKIIPKYYGSYTMMVPVEGRSKRMREIRVILREYIAGISLSKLNPTLLTKVERQTLMENVVNAELELDRRGVSMIKAFYPPKVILTEDVKCRIVVWNFAGAVFGSDIELVIGYEEPFIPGKMPSPLLKWKKVRLENLRYSYFVDWAWVRWLREKYQDTLQYISEEQEKLVLGLDEAEPDNVDIYVPVSSNSVYFATLSRLSPLHGYEQLSSRTATSPDSKRRSASEESRRSGEHRRKKRKR
ncbi:hypothetical protein TRVA0_067S00474 [Trichomonascus vanleenenianus]|uniref:uncharacterized protein n=1 Tax=Trichomonascus vanleenenianus TaxID=2268995 RepID=UPI003EC95BF4